MFIPLQKADAVQRVVYGSIDETLDHANEIMDYATAKPAFEAWSKRSAELSGGKSLGNVRAQHDLKKAAGKLIAIDFDDVAKRINFAAKIVDDAEWEKVDQGVYTGFSPGGNYVKRWDDGTAKRYTPRVGELSIVDTPCIPTAGFTMIKSDGVEEHRDFVMSKAYEPGNEATKARAEDLAKAAGSDALAKNFVVQARAELIAENAADALEKMAIESDPEPEDQPAPAPSPADKLAASLAKADAAIAVATSVPTDSPFADFAKAGAALNLLVKSVGDEPLLAKSLYCVERVACALNRFGEIAQSVAWEEMSENDTGSPLPKMALGIVGQTRDFLIAMVNEEVAEMMAQITTQLPNFTLSMIEGPADEMALASKIVDLVKADTDLMEKAGARNSKNDAKMIQSMHDNAVVLGANCDAGGEAAKAADLAAENERLAKAIDDASPRIEKLAESVETLTKARVEDQATIAALTKDVDALRKAAAPPKGAIFAVDKSTDTRVDEQVETETKPIMTLVQRANQARLG